MNTPAKNTARVLAVLGVALALVLTAFLAGRRSVAPGGASAENAETHTEDAHGHESDEAGVIAFTPAALANAHLEIEEAAATAVAAPLPVTGEVEANPSGVMKITPRVSGKVTAISVNVGDSVGAGAVLARVASADLAAAQATYRQATARLSSARQHLTRQRRLAGLGEFSGHKIEDARRETAEARGAVGTAKSEVAAARSAIQEAESETRALEAALEQTRTRAEAAQSRAARSQTLHDEQIVSGQDLEQAKADAREAQAGVAAAAAALAKGRSAVESARANLGMAQARLRAAESRHSIADKAETREEQIYKAGYATTKEIVEAEAAVREAALDQRAATDQVRLLGRTPGGGDTVAVTAPLAGRVTERTVTLGETVSPDKTLFTIVNLNSVWIQLRVYARDLPTVRTGQKVVIASDSAPGRALAGVVSHIGDTVDETTRTVNVRAAIPNADGILKPGTFVRGTIATGGTTRAVTVPREAVQTMEGATVVFVPKDHEGEFTARTVVTGETVGDRTHITQGLEPGERYVAAGAFTVKAQAMKAELGEGHGH